MRGDSTQAAPASKAGDPRRGHPPLWARLLRRPWPPVPVEVYKTRGCPLCKRALRILKEQRRSLGLRIRVRDITDDEELLQRHRIEIPVVFVAGRKRFMGRVDPAQLRRAVEAFRESRPRPRET